MTEPATANSSPGNDPLHEIQAILDDSPELLDTLPPVERAVAEALIE